MLIQPSLAEGVSSTLLEAMACKTPIVATKVGGNVEVIEHDKSGILVDAESCQNMAASVLDLLSDKEKAEKLREESFRRVQKYDWSHVGNLYLNIYESLL